MQYPIRSKGFGSTISKDANPLPPSLTPGVDQYLIWKGVRLVRRNGRDMVPLPVHDIHNLHGRLLQRALHRPSRLYSLGFGPWRRERDIQDPILPGQFLVLLAAEPAFAALTFKELEHELAATIFESG